MKTLTVPTLLGALLLATSASVAQTTIDNLTCFKVRDRTPRTQFRATLGANVGGQRCTLNAPARLACVPTVDTTVSPTPGGTRQGAVSNGFLCYPATCTRPIPASAQFTDPFGSRLVTFRAAKLLCVPASQSPAVTTTTVPGAGTTTTTVAGCRFSNGRCTGTCAAGSKCGSAVGTGSCECRSVSCGNADAPECNGFCSAGEACIFSFTGCSCVRVP